MPRAATPDSTKPFAVPVGRGVSLRVATGAARLATMAMGRDLPGPPVSAQMDGLPQPGRTALVALRPRSVQVGRAHR